VKRAYFILVCMSTLASLTRGQSLDAVLVRMDQAAKTFHSLTADVQRTDYSSLFSETNVEDGKFKMMKRAKTGVVLLADFTGRDSRKISIAGTKVLIYHPKANSVDEYDTRKFTKSADLLILVGFGTSRADLEKKYNMSLGGSETIGGKKTTRIDLKPKSIEEKNFFNVIQLWIPDGEGNPIQEKILSGKESKDYNLLLFSNEVINPSIPDADFELNLPAGVKVIKP
jgi:outer membrane lipoprotein-sorting protein